MNDRPLYRLPLCLLRHKHLLLPEAFQLFDRRQVCLDALPTELLCNFVQTGSSKGTVLSQSGGQPFESGYEIVIDDVGKSYQVKQVRQVDGSVFLRSIDSSMTHLSTVTCCSVALNATDFAPQHGFQ